MKAVLMAVSRLVNNSLPVLKIEPTVHRKASEELINAVIAAVKVAV
jgi:hypothetical protein